MNKKQLIQFLNINIGVFLAAITAAFFLSPNNIVGGGVTGLAIIVKDIFGGNIGIFIFLVNVILLVFAFIFMGKEFFFKTLYGSLMYPVYVSLIQFIMSKFTYEPIDLFLVVLFGGILMGFGMGITVKNGGSTGGVDIIQAILFKYLHIPYSTTLYVIDGILITIGMFNFGLTNALAAVVYLYVVGKMLDNVVFGGFDKRAVYVISDKNEEIKEWALNTLVRGVTNFQAEGGYRNDKRKVLLCVLSTREYFLLRNKVEELDKAAFVFVTKATEVRGLGFSLESPARKLANKR